MDIIIGIAKQSYFLLNEMSIYLLFGFFIAGIMHIFVRSDVVAHHLGKNSFISVLKAAVFGIPLPLCSCGVLPAALSLKKEGASKGAVVSFLISTPTTGIDSICATFSLLGGWFMAYRIIATFITATIAGLLTAFFDRRKAAETQNAQPAANCKLCKVEEQHKHSFNEKIGEVLRYAFRVLLVDVGNWLLLGILIGGVIGYFIPETFFEQHLGSSWQAMIAMLIIGIPMYVCATGSIPIAAALMLKGMSPGAAFVFLIVGPATNTVTMAVIMRELGKTILAIYLFSIALCSIMLGVALDTFWTVFGIENVEQVMQHAGMIPEWLKVSSSAVLVGLILFNKVKK